MMELMKGLFTSNRKMNPITQRLLILNPPPPRQTKDVEGDGVLRSIPEEEARTTLYARPRIPNKAELLSKTLLETGKSLGKETAKLFADPYLRATNPDLHIAERIAAHGEAALDAFGGKIPLALGTLISSKVLSSILDGAKAGDKTALQLLSNFPKDTIKGLHSTKKIIPFEQTGIMQDPLTGKKAVLLDREVGADILNSKINATDNTLKSVLPETTKLFPYVGETTVIGKKPTEMSGRYGGYRPLSNSIEIAMLDPVYGSKPKRKGTVAHEVGHAVQQAAHDFNLLPRKDAGGSIFNIRNQLQKTPTAINKTHFTGLTNDQIKRLMYEANPGEMYSRWESYYSELLNKSPKEIKNYVSTSRTKPVKTPRYITSQERIASGKPLTPREAADIASRITAEELKNLELYYNIWDKY